MTFLISSPFKKILKIQNEFAIAKSAFIQNYILWMRYKGSIVFFTIVNIIFPIIPIFLGRHFGGTNFATNFESSGGGKHPEAFIILGSNLWIFITFALFEFSTFIRDEQQQGTLESLILTPANQLFIVIGRGAASALMATVTFTLGTFFGLLLLDPNLLLSSDMISFLFAVIIAYLGFIPMVGIALGIGALVIRLKEVYNVLNIFLFLMGTLMGVFFPILLLPIYIQIMAVFFPGTWLVQDIRFIITGTPPMATYVGIDTLLPFSSLIIDLLLLAGLTILWGIIGWILFFKSLNSMKKSEGIGMF